MQGVQLVIDRATFEATLMGLNVFVKQCFAVTSNMFLTLWLLKREAFPFGFVCKIASCTTTPGHVQTRRENPFLYLDVLQGGNEAI